MKNPKTLICVDLQNDFFEEGSLAVPDSNEIIPVINELLPLFDLIIFTKDWHSPNMLAFSSQHENTKPFDKYTNLQGKSDILWPDHCIANTPGADLHPSIDLSKIKGDFYIFKKGLEPEFHPYSGFDGTELLGFLGDRHVKEVFILGLATDYCVKQTALDASKIGLETNLILDACASVEKDYDIEKEIANEDIWFIDSKSVETFLIHEK
jgi:nicotinamidase/pyrazinamidase